MKTADEIARNAAHAYRILKCHLVAHEEEEDDCVPVLELHFKDGSVRPAILQDRDVLPNAIVDFAERYGRDLVACALNIEVYTSHNKDRGKEWNKLFPFEHNDVTEGLLTVAVTNTGDSAVKYFHYAYLDDGGIYFEEEHLNPEVLGTMIYEIKGLWSHQEA